MMWWRIEFTAEDGIKTCDQVEASQKGSGRVCFIQATTKTDAVIAAKKWLADWRSKRQTAQRDKRAELRGKGICGKCCVRPQRPNKTTCERCSARGETKKSARKKRETLSDAEYYQRYLAQQEAHAAGVILREPSKIEQGERCSLPYGHLVLEVFDRLGPEAFRAWLVDKIEASKQA